MVYGFQNLLSYVLEHVEDKNVLPLLEVIHFPFSYYSFGFLPLYSNADTRYDQYFISSICDLF